MRTKIQRWGHSLALRIPKPFAIEAKLVDRTEVDLTVTNGRLVVTAATKPPQSLDDLLSRVTKRNLHEEVDTGTPVGKEGVVASRRHTPDRGDVVWITLAPQTGHEQAGRRPAVVLSPAAYNAKVGLALMCPSRVGSRGIRSKSFYRLAFR